MALSFPASPTNGQRYTANGRTWVYNSTKTKWEAPTTALADSNAQTLDGLDSTQFLRSDANNSFSGNITSANTGWIKFYNSAETDSNDGKIGSGVFGSGLNIVGTQTSSGLGRQVRLWGNVITNSGDTFWHSGNDGTGSGLDADTVDGKHASEIGSINGIFWENGTTITTSYTITANKNAMTAGPVTIADGVTVTIPDGSSWTVV